MDKTLQGKFIEIATDNIKAFLRSIVKMPLWKQDGYWWFGLMHAWGFPGYYWIRYAGFPVAEADKPITVQGFNKALIDLGVPVGAIKKIGAHTMVELENLAFVYRVKKFKDGREEFRCAFHWKGKKFSECGHTFLTGRGTARELAQYLIDVDALMPELKEACVEAYNEGIRERKVREIKLKTARACIGRLFNGELPECVVNFLIADSKPGAMDLIRLVVHDNGEPSWRTRKFDIPYELRNVAQLKHIQDFIENPEYKRGAIFDCVDDETGEVFACANFEREEVVS